MEILQLTQTITKAIDDKKGEDIKILDLQGLTEIADYFIIATGNTQSHLKSICDFIEEKVKEKGITPIRIQGYDEAVWIVIDYGDIVVHLFNPEAREYYQLEKFWRNAKNIGIMSS
ncbi:ribosome-associated protein [Anaerobranca californiensis DSM 14826]|uniref:Ribosomal silencing factor RsfS n=1 Tax=Anaerobranca californiensis DSM 14826 TaxID=1120989 RepID=A0A1M6NGX1_9FIRM|nr:ribosome silencing factor [Anaerobranca californiensis]SHJ95001.1 ribosome-associated protein [Anaerobranca californiensis DSM 14826]